ncbi:MAG: hypothetical protein Fur0027_14400 [Raineya sp.]
MDRFCLQACAKIYTEYACEFSLPKSLPEMIKDFEVIFDGYITRHTLAEEVAILFRAYVVDYLPVWKQKKEEQTGVKTERQEDKKAENVEKTEAKTEKTNFETIQQKAKKMHSKGFSFVQIGKELGVSDKTAKKYVTEV